MLKIHCDIITDFSLEKIQQLKTIARKLNFLLLEDRFVILKSKEKNR